MCIQSEVRDWIQLNTTVRRVTFDSITSTFTVVTVCNGAEKVENFDYVIVASGNSLYIIIVTYIELYAVLIIIDTF